MKKTIAFLLMLLLLFSCSACGKDDQRNEGSGDSETEQQQPQDDDVQSEDSTDAPGKIVLDGTPVRWDEFPMPTAETFGLTGEDAIIYNAIAQVYNPKVYADTFSQSPEDVTDLSLPAFEIYEKSKSENGNTIYYGVFYECDISIIISAKANLRVALFPQINSGEEGYFPILPPDGTDFCCRSKITSAAGCRNSLREKVNTEKINLSHLF